MGGADVVTLAEVEEIVAEPDLPERNRRITGAYVRLADEHAVLSGDERDAPWTAFGAWTSEDVGRGIRRELTDSRPFLRLMRRFRSDYDECTTKAAATLSVGNTEVFEEVGRACVGYHQALRDSRPQTIGAFLDGLAPDRWGEGVADPPVCLRDAFAAYEAARLADGRERAQAMAYGNLALAVVEQSRVQPHLMKAFTALADGWPRGLRRLMARLVTELVLDVRMGPVRLRPGRRFRLPYPPHLQELDPEFDRFAPILRTPRPDSDDWTVLADRMAVIAALMRALQQDPRLRASSPLEAAA